MEAATILKQTTDPQNLPPKTNKILIIFNFLWMELQTFQSQLRICCHYNRRLPEPHTYFMKLNSEIESLFQVPSARNKMCLRQYRYYYDIISTIPRHHIPRDNRLNKHGKLSKIIICTIYWLVWNTHSLKTVNIERVLEEEKKTFLK